jgi:hypothetical protein
VGISAGSLRGLRNWEIGGFKAYIQKAGFNPPSFLLRRERYGNAYRSDSSFKGSHNRLLRLSGFRGALAAGVTLFRLASLLLLAASFARALARLIAGFLPSIVGYIPATAFEVKTIYRH